MRRSAGGARAARTLVSASFQEAHALAAISGDGATILIEGDGPGAGRLRLFAGRPRPGGAFDPDRIARTVRLPANIAVSLGPLPAAVFVDPAGTWAAAAWTPADGRLSAEPACADLTLTFGDGTTPLKATVRCGSLAPAASPAD